MSLLNALRAGIKVADKVTKPLQPTVTIAPWTGSDGFGVNTYGAPVTYRAIVNQEQKSIFDDSGNEVLTQAYVAILTPITPNGAAGRVEPIDRRDRVTLPDGTIAPIVKTSGFIDAGIGRPMFSEIWLGL
jgi:hypothetical protein